MEQTISFDLVFTWVADSPMKQAFLLALVEVAEDTLIAQI